MITPSGVVATPTLGETSDGGACRWYMRDDQNYPGAKAPVLLFLHGGGGDETAFEYAGWNTLRNSLLEAGIYLPPSALEAWFVSTEHTDAVLDRIAEALPAAAKAAAGAAS